jgi:hypothetical protein
MRVLKTGLASGLALLGALNFAGCTSSSPGTNTGAAGAAGSNSQGSAGANGAAGSTQQGSGGSTSGVAGSGGGAAGSAAGGSGGSTGAGGAAGMTAGSGGAGGAQGTGGSTGAGGAAGAGTGGSTGAGGGIGPTTKTLPTGMSAGCGMAPPAGDNANGFKIHSLTVPACGTGAITPKCVAPLFAPGGRLEEKNGAYSFVARNYAVQLPTNYDVNKAYPLMVGGGGCGGGPTESGGGYNAGQGAGDAIRIGLSYTSMQSLGCFADGGNSCAITAADDPACVNTPEVPYFYAMLADVEAKYCIDKSKVYLGGYSSGGWETYTLGCAAADVIRGILPVNGGLRNHRPACTGPIPALMVTGANDPDNPVGPLVMDTAYAPGMLTAMAVNTAIASLDSNGSAPARDDILARNGCMGNATAMYDAAFPLCMKYTGCPEKYPVVWCSVTGAGHQNLSYPNPGGPTYYPSTGANSVTWNFLKNLP